MWGGRGGEYILVEVVVVRGGGEGGGFSIVCDLKCTTNPFSITPARFSAHNKHKHDHNSNISNASLQYSMAMLLMMMTMMTGAARVHECIKNNRLQY